MDKKVIKEQKKLLRRKILEIMERTPNFRNLPDDAPEVRQVRELGKEIEKLGKRYLLKNQK